MNLFSQSHAKITITPTNPKQCHESITPTPDSNKYNNSNNTLADLSYDNTNTKPIIDFHVTAAGNLQLFRQDSNNRELYTYQLVPQLKIPAGSTTGTLTIRGLEDLSSEPDETIIVTPGIVINSSLTSATPITLTITNNDELSTIAFTLSAPKIVEGSTTNVTLTATPSVVSGNLIRIPFTVSGTAIQNTEYTVSASLLLETFPVASPIMSVI